MLGGPHPPTHAPPPPPTPPPPPPQPAATKNHPRPGRAAHKTRSPHILFSSRRRHTRCLSDWSSDVCSSDLWRQRGEQPGRDPCRAQRRDEPRTQIGRASGRERVEISVVAGALPHSAPPG